MGQEKINLDEYTFRFVYIEAMDDAVRQKAYNGMKKCFKEKDVWDSVKGDLTSLVDNVLKGKYLKLSQEKYDEDFLNTAIRVCEWMNKYKVEETEFTFGNAQKLINILLKLFYISSYINNSLRENFKFCHCPMDWQLLSHVWKSRAKLDDNIKLGKYEMFLKSWGEEDFKKDENGKIKYPDRYMLFQQAVRCLAEKEKLKPLEYDYYILGNPQNQ